MDISSSNILPPQINTQITRVNSSQQPVEKIKREREQDESNQQNRSNNRAERFDVDPQALAVVEKEYQTNVANGSSAQSSTNTAYDKPEEQNQTAISAYQSVDTLAQKESVKQLFGVDLYA